MQDKSSFLLPPSGSPGISPATSVINRRKYFQTDISSGFINENSIGLYFFKEPNVIDEKHCFVSRVCREKSSFKNSIDRQKKKYLFIQFRD